MRYYHGCAVLRNNIEGAEYPFDIVVVGGKSSINNEILASTEIYKSDLGKWESGPDYLNTIYGIALVNYDSDTIFAFGGSTTEGGGNIGAISVLSKTNLAQWEMVDNLYYPRSAHVAFAIPESAVTCEGDERMVFDNEMLEDEELIEEFELQ